MTKLLFTSALLLCLFGASFGLSVQPIFDPIMTCMCVFANGSSCCPEDFEKPTHLPVALFAEPIITCDCILANGTSCCPYDTPIDIRPIVTLPIAEPIMEPIAVADDSFMIMSCMCMFANGSSCCPEDFESPSHLPTELFAEPIISCDCMMLGGQSCCPTTGSPVSPITPIISPIIARPIISEPIAEPLAIDEFAAILSPIVRPIFTCDCLFANGSSCCPEDFEVPSHLPSELFELSCDCLFENGTSCCPETIEREPIVTCDCVLVGGESCCPSTGSPITPIISPIIARPIISEPIAEPVMEPLVDNGFLVRPIVTLPIAVAEDSFMIMSCMCMFANGSSCCPEDFEKPSHLPSELFEISCDCLFENGTSCCPETIEREPIVTCDCMMLGGQSCCPTTGSPVSPITPIISPIVARPIISEPIDEPVMEPLVDNGFMIMSCMCMFANGSSCCPEDFAKPTHLPKAILEADDEFMVLHCDCMMADGQSCC